MCARNLHVCLPMQFMSCPFTLPFRCSFYRSIACSSGRGGFARHLCSAVPTASTLRSYLITDACGCRASKCNFACIELHIAPGLRSHTACWLSTLIILALTIIRTQQIPYHVSDVFYLRSSCPISHLAHGTDLKPYMTTLLSDACNFLESNVWRPLTLHALVLCYVTG